MQNTARDAATIIVPYCHVDGVPTFKDSEVMGFFEKIERDGLKDIVFAGGDISSKEAFLREMQRHGAAMLYVVYVGDLQAGLIWLTHFEGRSCRVHFTSFSESWGMDTVSIGRDAIRQVIYMVGTDGGYVFDVLLGLTPTDNVRALRWLDKVGLKRVGDIPNALWDAKQHESVTGTLMFLTRQEV